MTSLPSLALVGPGRAGRALARSWGAAGGGIATVVASDARKAAEAAAAFGAVAGFGLLALPDALPGAVLVLAVPDDVLGTVAAALVGRSSASVAFHLAGALPAEEIAVLREGGRPIGSLHPLRAFSGGGEETWRGALVAVEGDAGACEAGLRFVEALDARGRRLDAAAKSLYHAGATMAAGGSVALVGLAARAWALAGIDEPESREALTELALSALSPARSESFEAALTGPVARRDVRTIRAHRDALAAFPELLRAYASLAEETLARTPGRGREDEIRTLLAGKMLDSYDRH